MMNYRPKMFEEAEKSKAPSKLSLQILIFIAVFFIIYLFESISSSILIVPTLLAKMNQEGLFNLNSTASYSEIYHKVMNMSTDQKIMIPLLFCTVFGTILAIVYCRCIEKRSLNSMGIRKSNAFSHYIRGLFVGIALMSIIVGITAVSGITNISVVSDIKIGVIMLFFAGFLVQGMSEEIIFRGYLMNSIGGKHSTITALIVSSLAFAFAHILNPGLSILAFINLTIFAVFAGLYIICFDDIWGACAIHSIWNFTQGNVFGIRVSGSGSTDSILSTTASTSHAWLSGGDFGIEGSIITTIVLLAATIAMIMQIKRKSQNTFVVSEE